MRDAILENFGRQLVWWTTILLELAALIVIELVIQAIRRVYWPTDEDLMQRVEKDQMAYSALKDRAAKAAESGEAEGFELQDIIPVMDAPRAGGKRRFGLRRKGGDGLGQSGEDHDASMFTPQTEEGSRSESVGKPVGH